MRKKSIIASAVLLILLCIWELISKNNANLLFVLPAPSTIVSTLLESRERLTFHAFITLKEMATGFVLATAAAFPLAWIMLRFSVTRFVLQPFFIIIQCLPMFTLAPIMIIWFGWSFIAIVIPTALMIFFPLTLNIYQGIRSTPSSLLDFFKVNGASHTQTFFKLRLPWALPHIFAGFRISAAIAGIGAIAGEWAGAQNGLGILMLESRRNADLEMTFAALFSLTILSSAFYGFILLLEKYSSYPKKFWKLRHGLSIFLIVLCTGCHKTEVSKTRLLLDWLPNPNHAPLYVGIKNGYFHEEGIDLFLQKLPDNVGGIPFLTSNQTDLLISHLPSVMKATSRGAEMKIIGLLIKEPLNSIIYRQTEHISKPQDLSYKNLGYCIGSSETVFLDYILKQGCIEPQKKVNVGLDTLSTLATQKVDFLYGCFWNIEPFQLATMGVKTGYFKLSEFGMPNYYEMIVMANTRSKESSPEFVGKFQRALQKSIEFCKNYPDKAFLIYQNCHQDKRLKTVTWEKEAWQVTYPIFVCDQTIDSHVLTCLYQFLYKNKVLKQPFDYQELIP